jgi:hypothetical protein
MNWITDRVPTREEAAVNGNVLIPRRTIGWTFANYKDISVGQPWLSPFAKESPPPQPEPFVVRCYSADDRPSVKGNGFDGLEIGGYREEAEEFISWVNARLSQVTLAPPEPEPRKVVQIAVCNATDKTYLCLYAVCNDGTAWAHFPALDGTPWHQLPPIPQP